MSFDATISCVSNILSLMTFCSLPKYWLFNKQHNHVGLFHLDNHRENFMRKNKKVEILSPRVALVYGARRMATLPAPAQFSNKRSLIIYISNRVTHKQFDWHPTMKISQWFLFSFFHFPSEEIGKCRMREMWFYSVEFFFFTIRKYLHWILFAHFFSHFYLAVSHIDA